MLPNMEYYKMCVIGAQSNTRNFLLPQTAATLAGLEQLSMMAVVQRRTTSGVPTKSLSHQPLFCKQKQVKIEPVRMHHVVVMTTI